MRTLSTDWSQSSWSASQCSVALCTTNTSALLVVVLFIKRNVGVRAKFILGLECKWLWCIMWDSIFALYCTGTGETGKCAGHLSPGIYRGRGGTRYPACTMVYSAPYVGRTDRSSVATS